MKKDFFAKTNSKGFFSFILTLVLILILFNITIQINNTTKELEKTKNELVKTEIAQKERTIIENNIDKIIKVKLEEQLISKNYNTTKIQKEINSKLIQYLSNKVNSCDTIYKTTKELTLNFLNENTAAFIFDKDGLTYAEYTFTSNITKSNNICKEFGDKTIIEFKIPNDYSIKIID